ncbi:MAG: cytochrome C [Sideroxydans sp.]|jgi:cytochrome c556
MKKKSIVAIFLTVITLSAFQVQASEPLELKKVMQELSRNMQIITDGISRENWKLVAETAPVIAEHPQPPLAEKARIISFMGAEMSRFKAFDMQTHEAAHEMMHAAHEQNGQRVIDAFQKVQSSCLNCHQAFRASFVKHFYGKSGE